MARKFDGEFNLAFYKLTVKLYCIAQNVGEVKLWQIDCFKSFGKENVGEFTIAIISYYGKSGIWLGKILANDKVCTIRYPLMLIFCKMAILKYVHYVKHKQTKSKIWLAYKCVSTFQQRIEGGN